MKRLLAALAFAIPLLAFGAAYDVGIDQRPAANNIWEKRLLASPATTGILAYNPTTLLPVWLTLGSGLQVNLGVLDSMPSTWASVSGKPEFAAVATSGNYADLTGRPAAPPAQVQTDWVAASGLGVLLNKPTTIAGYGITDAATAAQLATKFDTPAGSTAQYLRGDGSLAMLPAQVPTDWSAIPNKPATFPPSAHTQPWSTITATPTTVTGYGLTDAATTAQLATKFDVPAGSTAQYLRGDGSLATLPVATQVSATRTLNTAFQVSTTRPALVNYSVQITVTASISGGQNGEVVLEIASNSAFTANVQTVAIVGEGQTYTLAIALQGVQPQTSVLTGIVPAGYYARLRTVNVTGLPAFSYRAGQETTL